MRLGIKGQCCQNLLMCYFVNEIHVAIQNILLLEISNK